jgi:hypothetical protein
MLFVMAACTCDSSMWLVAGTSHHSNHGAKLTFDSYSTESTKCYVKRVPCLECFGARD